MNNKSDLLKELRKAVYGFYDEIASRAGVNNGTVSKALRDVGSIKTKLKVIKAAIDVRDEQNDEEAKLLDKITVWK